MKKAEKNRRSVGGSSSNPR